MSSLTIASAQIKLSYKPKKGSTYEHKSEMTMSIKQNVMGQEINMEMEMDVTYLMEIKSKTSQETHVQLTYKDFVYIVSSPMMSMGYDSKNPVENPSEMDIMLDKMFRNVAGSTFTLVINPDGSVKSVSGMDAIREKILKSISGDGQLAQQIAGQMVGQQFDDQSMKSTFDHSFKIYPDRAVKAGDSWNSKNATVMSGMAANITTTYTLKEVSKKKADVVLSSEVEMLPSETMEGKITGTQTGTMLLDTDTGISSISEITQNMKGAVTTMGMEIEMEINSKSKITTKLIK
jgi:hypothetical protein